MVDFKISIVETFELGFRVVKEFKVGFRYVVFRAKHNDDENEKHIVFVREVDLQPPSIQMRITPKMGPAMLTNVRFDVCEEDGNLAGYFWSWDIKGFRVCVQKDPWLGKFFEGREQTLEEWGKEIGLKNVIFDLSRGPAYTPERFPGFNEEKAAA